VTSSSLYEVLPNAARPIKSSPVSSLTQFVGPHMHSLMSNLDWKVKLEFVDR
jgi:hypothetical protein